MPSPIVVNGDKSLVLVDTKSLTDDFVVLLSSIRDPGRIVTIRDSVGYLSTPQKIIVSTMANVRFADGTSSINITKPYSYVTVTSRDPVSWNFTNTFAFPDYETVANVNTITATSLTTSNIYVRDFLSTLALTTGSLNATSTAAIYGPLYASTLVVAAPNPSFKPFLTDPGYVAYVQGNLKTYASMEIDGAAQFTNTISTGGNVAINGNISTLGSFGARGDITTLGNLYAPNGGGFFRTLNVASSASITGPVTFSNALSIFSSLNVLERVTAPTVIASTLFVSNGSIQLGSSGSIQARPTDILFSDPITAPAISTVNLLASNAVATSNLTIFRTLNAEFASSFVMSSTQIVNPGGTLLVDGLTANSVTLSNSLTTTALQTSTLQASTINLTGTFSIPASGYVAIGAAITSTISTGVLGAQRIFTDQLVTSSLATSSIQISNSFLANNLASFTASNTTLQNQGGSITTGNLNLQNLLTASTITTTSGRFETAGGAAFRLIASNVVMDNASISSLYASSLATSSITATRLTIGAPAVANTNGPTFSVESTLFSSQNVVITGGPGDFLTPFTVSNVKPAGLGPTDPYPIEVSFRLNFNGPYIPGYFAQIPGLTLFPNGQPTSELTLKSLNDSNVVTSLYGIFGSNQTFSTDPNAGGISVPTGVQPSSFFHLTGTMVGNSAFSFQFFSRSNANISVIDSNAVITMNNGILQWPYSLNGTTIQNSLNDMSVRTLYYYGGLNFASDPALKENIEDADLGRCTEIVENIPLYHYKFKDFYLSTFGVQDAHRLGVLATDLEEVFPKSVTYTTIDGFDSTIRMIDTQQLEMAHLGATKALLARVEDLKKQIEALGLGLGTHEA